MSDELKKARIAKAQREVDEALLPAPGTSFVDAFRALQSARKKLDEVMTDAPRAAVPGSPQLDRPIRSEADVLRERIERALEMARGGLAGSISDLEHEAYFARGAALRHVIRILEN